MSEKKHGLGRLFGRRAKEPVQEEPTAYATAVDGRKIDLREVRNIAFACPANDPDAELGPFTLENVLNDYGYGAIKVTRYNPEDVPADSKVIVVEEELSDQVKKEHPDADIIAVQYLLNTPEYVDFIGKLQAARVNTNPENEALGEDFHGGILLKKNILTNRPSTDKEQVLRDMGRVLYESGYVTEKYTEALLEKEKVFNTAIGNNLAIPHGIESMMSEIKNSGIAIFTYPDGVDWGNGNTVNLVIGIAAAGDDHVDLLSKIAMQCMDADSVQKIVHMNRDEIYELFKD